MGDNYSLKELGGCNYDYKHRHPKYQIERESAQHKDRVVREREHVAPIRGPDGFVVVIERGAVVEALARRVTLRVLEEPAYHELSEGLEDAPPGGDLGLEPLGCQVRCLS